MVPVQNPDFWMDLTTVLIQTAVIYGLLILCMKTTGRGVLSRFAPVDMMVMFLIVEMAAVQIMFLN
jgi:uncharacterized membrane protein YcaP (DUF421 family)